jgi:hypothetical protein
MRNKGAGEYSPLNPRTPLLGYYHTDRQTDREREREREYIERD